MNTLVRIAPFLSVATIAVAAQSPAAPAKEQPAHTMEAFTVTGTNIRRIDEERTLPVTQLDADELIARNTPTAADLFETITSAAMIELSENNVLGADARGDNTTINLRGVGSGNTLVLLKGLSVTFDYFRLQQRQVVAAYTSSDVLLDDELLLDRATQAQLAAGKTIAQVDLGSGTANYLGSTQVRRVPVTAPDIAFFNTFNGTRPAAQQRAPVGRVFNVTENYVNLAGRDIAGWEASVQYRLPRTALGQFSLRSEATYSLQYDQRENLTDPAFSLREENGRPRWRANGSLQWRRGGLGASWFTNYWGEFVDTSAATTAAIFQALGQPDYIRHYNNDGLDRYYYRVKPSIFHTATVSYAFSRRAGYLGNASIRLGVSNVFDTKPPFADETRGAFTGTVTPRGRVFTLQASKRF